MKVTTNLYSKLKTIYGKAFGKYLLTTNIVTSGILMGIGDGVEQLVELRSNNHPTGKFDWKRISHMICVGFVIGYPQHYFYLYLDRQLPGNTNKIVIKKIFLDQIIASPVSIILFFYGLGLLEKGSIAAGTEEVKSKFTTVYMMDWIFWPPIQYFNFFYLPSKYRVLYVNGATMLYDVLLSYVKFIYEPADPTNK